MSRVRPRPIVGKKDAERLGISPLTGASPPEFHLDHAAIHRACRLAGLPETDAEKMVELTRGLIGDYLIERRTDAHSATATEVHALASRLDSAAAEVLDVLNGRLLSPFLAADIQESLPNLQRAATELRQKAGEPQRGGGTKPKAEAQVRLAAKLLQAFGANRWPMGTGPKSLMAEALRICLQAGGTRHAHPNRILAAAKEKLHD